MSVEFLARLPLFDGVSRDDLTDLLNNSEPVSLQPGERLIQEGDPGDAIYVVLEGQLTVTKRAGQQDLMLATRGPGEVIGEMSLLDQLPRSASVHASCACRLVRIGEGAFLHMLGSSPDAMLKILRTVTSRWRNTSSLMRQTEKMAALGTLAAGMAHELNNPAAAARRGAGQLRAALAEWERYMGALDALTLSTSQREVIGHLREEIALRAAAPVTLDVLTRCDMESALQDWLEARGVGEAWNLAPVLVGLGWDDVSLPEVVAAFSGAALNTVLCWLVAGCNVQTLLSEVAYSTERVSQIVQTMKAYAYLDQAPLQDVDLHEGLESTLAVLRPRIEPGVTVRREYAEKLPRIEAYASELNQVWTNLIDNALYAMQGRGTLTVRTQGDDTHVQVEISDTGEGIPDAIQARIFEPFFTTRPPGAGSGMGLTVAHNIVTTKQQGQIRVRSCPGATCFEVTLPVRLKREAR